MRLQRRWRVSLLVSARRYPDIHTGRCAPFPLHTGLRWLGLRKNKLGTARISRLSPLHPGCTWAEACLLYKVVYSCHSECACVHAACGRQCAKALRGLLPSIKRKVLLQMMHAE